MRFEFAPVCRIARDPPVIAMGNAIARLYTQRFALLCSSEKNVNRGQTPPFSLLSSARPVPSRAAFTTPDDAQPASHLPGRLFPVSASVFGALSSAVVMQRRVLRKIIRYFST